MSFQGAHYSKNFFKLLDIWPKGGYLPFPSSETRGLAQSKATIIVENVSNKLVVFRVNLMELFLHLISVIIFIDLGHSRTKLYLES